MVIVAVEEAPFLLAMQRRIGRIEVQNQPSRGTRVRLHELAKQQLVNGPSRAPVRSLLPAAQGGGSGQGRHARGRRLHGQVMAQLVMIVQVFVAQSQGVDALPQQRQQRVLATGFAVRIAQPPGERLGQTEFAANGAEQRDAAVAGDVAAAKLRLDLAASRRNLPGVWV